MLSLKSGKRGKVRAAAGSWQKIHHLLRYFRPELCLPGSEAGGENTGTAAVKLEANIC